MKGAVAIKFESISKMSFGSFLFPIQIKYYIIDYTTQIDRKQNKKREYAIERSATHCNGKCG